MELLLIFGGAVVWGILSGVSPPRYQRLRGAEQWTDAKDAQQRHLDHWESGTDPHGEEDEV